MQGRVFSQFGEMNTGEIFDDIWAKIDSKELEEYINLDITRRKI